MTLHKRINTSRNCEEKGWNEWKLKTEKRLRRIRSSLSRTDSRRLKSSCRTDSSTSESSVTASRRALRSNSSSSSMSRRSGSIIVELREIVSSADGVSRSDVSSSVDRSTGHRIISSTGSRTSIAGSDVELVQQLLSRTFDRSLAIASRQDSSLIVCKLRVELSATGDEAGREMDRRIAKKEKSQSMQREKGIRDRWKSKLTLSSAWAHES